MAKENPNLDTLGTRLHYTLRIASAMCFIGHGAFGIITKKIWLNYFAVFGIGPAMATTSCRGSVPSTFCVA